MNSVDCFLDDLESSGYWEDVCSICKRKYNNPEPSENPDDLCNSCWYRYGSDGDIENPYYD